MQQSLKYICTVDLNLDNLLRIKFQSISYWPLQLQWTIFKSSRMSSHSTFVNNWVQTRIVTCLHITTLLEL